MKSSPFVERPKANYVPIVEELLGVAVKSVTDPKTIAAEENCGGAWLEINKKTGKLEKHLYHLVNKTRTKNLSEKSETEIEFPFPAKYTSRTTIHFFRDLNKKSPETRMVAGRFEKDESGNDKPAFGFSIDGQRYLNLKYEITDAAEVVRTGFEPLFLEIGLPEKNPLHIKVEISEKYDSEKRILLVTVAEISENQLPDCLKNAQLLF